MPLPFDLQTIYFGAAVIGGALLWLGFRVIPRVEKELAARGLAFRLPAALIVPGLLLALASGSR